MEDTEGKACLVINWSGKKWKGPRTHYDMFGPLEPGLRRFIPNYRINLVSPSEIKASRLGRFRTPLGQVFKFLKYADGPAFPP